MTTPGLASDLVRMKPDVVVTGFGTVAAKAGKAAGGGSIPVVFMAVGDTCPGPCALPHESNPQYGAGGSHIRSSVCVESRDDRQARGAEGRE